LAGVILDSGAGVLAERVHARCTSPATTCSPPAAHAGLPIGNLTSQFWSNVYLNDFDWFVQRELSCSAYLRYVDDFALFGDDRQTLWGWKEAVIARLAAGAVDDPRQPRRRCCRRAAASPGWASSCIRCIVCSSGVTQSTSRVGWTSHLDAVSGAGVDLVRRTRRRRAAAGSTTSATPTPGGLRKHHLRDASDPGTPRQIAALRAAGEVSPAPPPESEIPE
jgi:hypothetical protein